MIHYFFEVCRIAGLEVFGSLRPNARFPPQTNPLRNSQGDAQTVLAQMTLAWGEKRKRVLNGRKLPNTSKPINFFLISFKDGYEGNFC